MLTEADLILPKSWFAIDCATGAQCGEGADDIADLPGAERLVLLLAGLAAVRAGQVELDAPCAYTADFQRAASHGVLRWLEAPKRLAFRDTLAQTIITADQVGMAMACAHLRDAGLDPAGTFAGWLTRTGLGGLTLAGFEAGPYHVQRMTVRGSARSLATIWDALGRLAEGEAPGVETGLDGDLARVALDILASAGGRDGIPGYLPSWGPFSQKAPHLMVDEGRAANAERRNRHDSALVWKDGRRLFAAAVICHDVPPEVAGRPGIQRAAREMAVIGRRLWDRA